MKPQIKLVTYTGSPVESVYHLWEASKVDGHVPSIEEIKDSPVLMEKARKLFWQVIHQQIPVGEHISFVFMLENVSVSFREQMVRHRVGTKVGDRIGVDIIPDLATSSWWSQSMRIQDMGLFASRGMYRVPDTLTGKVCKGHCEGTDGGLTYNHKQSATAEEVFREAMDSAQQAYNRLVQAGVPLEDAREVIPLGAQHRISWALNLQTLLHVLGKRGCYILQLGLWGPIIEGMIHELVAKVDPSFQTLLAPPCVGADGKFNSCIYPVENERRLDGRDAHSLCPLYVCRDEAAEKVLAGRSSGFFSLPLTQRPAALSQLHLPMEKEMMERAEGYRKLWVHDPFLWDTGKDGAK